MPEPTEPWREPVRGGHATAAAMSRSGKQQLEAMLDGETPAPPLSRLTGLHVDAVGDGQATFTMPLTRWLAGGDGTVSLGALTIPADAAMACAILTQLPAWTPLTTTELALRLVRPVAPGGSIHAHGRVISLGSPLALSEASLLDAGGDLVAHGTSLCMILPPVSAQPADGEAAPAQAAADGPDAWQREPPGTGSPLQALTGLTPVDTRAGEAEFTIPASPWFEAPPPGRVQGGVVALLADTTLAAAVRTTAAGAFTPVELKVNYLRPLPSDGRRARAKARVVHSGRRIAVAAGEVTDADGRPIAIVSGSGLVAPAPES